MWSGAIAARKHDAELLRKLADSLPDPINNVAVVGGGLMGAGASQFVCQQHATC